MGVAMENGEQRLPVPQTDGVKPFALHVDRDMMMEGHQTMLRIGLTERVLKQIQILSKDFPYTFPGTEESRKINCQLPIRLVLSSKEVPCAASAILSKLS